MSMFDELKRRNVVKMAALYVVASWLLLQVADVLFDAMELPAAWDRLVIALLALGFPIVMIFAWVFEMTPEGLKRQSEVDRGQSVTEETGRKLNLTIIVLLVLAILAVGADRLVPETTQVVEESVQTSAVNSAPERSIAVLPFANRSSREDDIYFVDGMHDDILTQLAKVDALTVTSRTSVEPFRDPTQQGGIREIAGVLGVRNILEGGVQRSGDRIRINVQLIDVTSDGHLWAETYERELTASNLFSVQGEIAAAVAKALRAALAPDEESALGEAPTESLAAYDLYLLGRHHWNQRTEASIQLARDYFEQAIAEDPEFVPALSGLADSYMLLVDYGNLAGDDAFPAAQEVIDKAMAIDGQVSEVWASLGLMRRNQSNHEGAEDAFLRAIELDRDNFSAWHWYAGTLNRMRRFDEALEAAQTAYALEPMSKPINELLADQYYRLGDHVRARQHYERSATLDPEQAVWYESRAAETHQIAGDHSRAITLLRRILVKDPSSAYALNNVAESYLALGDIAEARRWYSYAEDLNIFQRGMVWVYEAERDFDGAIVYLEDKLKLDQNRRSRSTLYWLFRASYLKGDLPLARDYMAESLEILAGRFEINPSDYWPLDSLLRATFLIRHGDDVGLDSELGHKMLDEILASLISLQEQGHKRPITYASLATAQALKGDSLEAFASLNEAVDRGYRNSYYILSQPAFDGLRDRADFVAITERIEGLLNEDRVKLAETKLEPYTRAEARTPIPMSRERFRDYAGYYSDGNVVLRIYFNDDGAFAGRLGQNPPFEFFPYAENKFFMPAVRGFSIDFFADDSGQITHLEGKGSGNVWRMKAVDGPPPAVQLDRAVLERYEGTYAHDRLSRANENQSEADIWTCVISVDEDGRAWIDFDNQPILEMVPYSETEFYTPGFLGSHTFFVNPDTGIADRMEMDADGRVLEFYRQ